MSMELPKKLTRVVASIAGNDRVSSLKYRAYWCEECQRYSVWPGADWGASHYFCDDCLTKLELSRRESQ